jgi:hypothetical protein
MPQMVEGYDRAKRVALKRDEKKNENILLDPDLIDEYKEVAQLGAARLDEWHSSLERL